MDPVSAAAVAKVVTPEHLDAAGNVVEKTGKGVGHIFDSVGNIGSKHHEISADARVREAEIIAGMSPEQMKIYLDHKKAASGSTLETLASFTPLGPVLAAKKLFTQTLG